MTSCNNDLFLWDVCYITSSKQAWCVCLATLVDDDLMPLVCVGKITGWSVYWFCTNLKTGKNGKNR